MATNREMDHAWGVLGKHIDDFEREFRNKEPRAKDWRPQRFALRDVFLGWLVSKYNYKESVILVDVFLSVDPPWANKGTFSGTKHLALYLLSKAYQDGSTMGIRFTKNVESGTVPLNIEALANSVGVELKFADEGFITPKESRMLYLALTPFSPEARQKVMELSIANLVSPERICYLVHHGVWTLGEMEMILLGSEHPEWILLADMTPREYQLFYDMIFRLREPILASFLDRVMKQKELVDEKGNVYDLEGNDRDITIRFDPRYYAKIYELGEDAPFPYTKYHGVIPKGKRMVVMIRAYDWPDLRNHFTRDLEAMKELIHAYRDGNTYFFYLVPRDVEGENLEDYEKALRQIGATLMICPELLVRLDEDALHRLDTETHIRHDVATGKASEREFTPSANPSIYNSTEITFVAVNPDTREGVFELPKLVVQALHDEKELASGVNRRNVIQRHHRVMDRMHYLAQLALAHPETPRLTLPASYLSGFAKIFAGNPDEFRNQRMLASFVPHNGLEQHIVFMNSLIGGSDEIRKMLEPVRKFLADAAHQGLAILAVQDKHAKPTMPIPIVIREKDQVERAFAGQFVPDWVIDYKGKNIYEITSQMVWNAVNASKKGQAHSLNLSDFPHMVIGETLHTFAYKAQPKDAEHPVSVNIVYTDGSTARPFPLFQLRKRSEEELRDLRESTIMLNIGSQSCRHPEMDTQVDLYWFLNIEINHAGNTSAEKDEFCYQETLRKLSVLTKRNQRIRIAFYQTGFEPAAIGFYRAVTQFLMETSDKPPFIEIVPMIWNGQKKDYESGSSWA